MNQAEFLADNPYATFGRIAAEAPADARLSFIRKTYMHLAAAIYAFVLLEYALFKFGVAEWMMSQLSNIAYGGLILLGGFLLVSWIANSWARSNTSVGLQYAGLFLYVVIEAIIFAPLLYIAQGYAISVGDMAPNVPVIPAAGITTLLMFGGLTAIVFFTRKDFSFLGTALGIAGFGFLALIVVSAFAGFNLGVLFFAAMIIFACGYILYDTSNVLHHYRTEQHVAASLALFASVALLFWYVIRLFLAFGNRD